MHLAVLLLLLGSLDPAADAIREAEHNCRKGNYDAAIEISRKILKGSPGVVPARLILGRALLKKDEVQAALEETESALASSPRDPGLQALLGEVYFRQAEFELAEAAYKKALDADPKCARAHLGAGNLLATQCLRRSARSEIETAYELDPDDPDVLLAWARTRRAPTQEIEGLERYLRLVTDEDPKLLGQMRNELDLARQLNGRPTYVVTSKAASYRIKLLLLYDPLHLRKVGLLVSFNGGKPRRLQLDTGGYGILLNPRAAQAAGIKGLSASTIRGVGDEGEKSGYFGLAESVRIGDLELRDCTVRFAGKSLVHDADGLIGTDVFRTFLIRLDLPNMMLELAPLLETRAITAPQVSQQELDDSDRETLVAAAGLETFRSWRHLMLVRTTVNDSAMGHFVVDTGGFADLISLDLLKKASGSVMKSRMGVVGLSGQVKDVYSGHEILLRFGRFHQRDPDILSIDLKKLSKDTGVEVGGVLGLPLLRVFTTTINYRDGVVKFEYQKK